MSSTYYRALKGVQNAIQGIAHTLTGLTGGDPLATSQVYLRRLATDRSLTLPCVIVSLTNLPETVKPLSTTEDEVGYAVAVAIVVAVNQDVGLDGDELAWRERVWDLFHHTRPVDVAASLPVNERLLETFVEPGAPIDLGLFQGNNLHVSGLTVRVVTQRSRAA